MAELNSEPRRGPGSREEDPGTLRRAMVQGALACALVSLAHLAVTGVVVDEVVVPAQIISGSVEYPPGHPHDHYYRQTYCLPNYLAAAAWTLVPDVRVLSALRNLAFLFLSAFAPFSLATLLTRSAAWGYAAMAVTLSEALVPFQGSYTFWTFPHFYSHGHIGLHLAVLGAVALLARSWRAGGLLLGLLPAMHLAMPLVLWPWGACWLLFGAGRPRGKEWRRLAVWTGAGLAVSGAFAIFLLALDATEAVGPPYDGAGDGAAICRNFLALTDYHRNAVRVRSLAYLASPLMLLCVGVLPFWSMRRKADGAGETDPARVEWGWALLLAAGAWAVVYGAHLVDVGLGGLPEVFLRAMPGRFSNLPLVLLPALAVTSIASVSRRAGRPGAAFAITIALLAGAASVAWLDRIALASNLLFALWGVVLATSLVHARGDRPSGYAAVAATMVSAWVLLRRFHGSALPLSAELTLSIDGLTPFLMGFAATAVAAVAIRRLEPPAGSPRPERVLACVALVAAACFLRGPKLWDRINDVREVSGLSAGRWDRLSAFDADLVRWLDANAGPGEMLLPALTPPSMFQAKTGRPVLVEIDTLHLMTYMPGLAPAIGALARDLFGVDYAHPRTIEDRLRSGRLSKFSPVWIESWERRGPEEWKVLADKYRFRLVLAPTRSPLRLPSVLAGPVWTLYEIPTSLSSRGGTHP